MCPFHLSSPQTPSVKAIDSLAVRLQKNTHTFTFVDSRGMSPLRVGSLSQSKSPVSHFKLFGNATAVDKSLAAPSLCSDFVDDVRKCFGVNALLNELH